MSIACRPISQQQKTYSLICNEIWKICFPIFSPQAINIIWQQHLVNLSKKTNLWKRRGEQSKGEGLLFYIPYTSLIYSYEPLPRTVWEGQCFLITFKLCRLKNTKNKCQSKTICDKHHQSLFWGFFQFSEYNLSR